MNKNEGTAAPKITHKRKRFHNLSKKEIARVTKRKPGNKPKGPKRKKKRCDNAQPPPKPRLHAAVHDRLHHHPATTDQRWPPIHQIIKETSCRLQDPNFHNNSPTNAETHKARILRIRLKAYTTWGREPEIISFLNPTKLTRYIYCIYHPFIKHHYVGETYKGFARFKGHFYAARRIAHGTEVSGDRTMLHIAM